MTWTWTGLVLSNLEAVACCLKCLDDLQTSNTERQQAHNTAGLSRGPVAVTPPVSGGVAQSAVTQVLY